MNDLKKYWYVSNEDIRVIVGNVSTMLAFADLIEGHKVGNRLIVHSLNGERVYGNVELPITYFREVDTNNAWINYRDYDVDKN